MYLPAYYDDPDTEYWALVEGVTMWDVGVERTVEVTGPDADRLIDFITCRDLTKCAVGQGKYMPVIAPDGGIVNDPVLLHVAENKWWMQLADSDAGLYAAGWPGRAGSMPRSPTRTFTPCRCRAPSPAKTLEKLVGPAIYDIKYYWLASSRSGIPGRHQPDRLDRGSGVRSQCARRQRRRALERGARRRRGVRDSPDRSV